MSTLDFEKLCYVFQDTKELLHKYCDQQRIESLSRRLEAYRSGDKPTILIYGVYNAGKSTLINALTGAESAKTADKPQTDAVSSFHWKSFELLDSPGIDAPIPHQEITDEQLQKSDVVVFVLASRGESEELKTYEVICKQVKRKRRVAIVINNKTGLDLQSTAMMALQDKIRMNLQSAATKEGLTNILGDVPILLVNAKSAFKAKVEQKNKLLINSGLPELERQLYSFLEETSAGDVLRAISHELTELLDSAHEKCQELGQASDCSGIDRLINWINEEKGLIQATLNAEITRTARSLKSRAIPALEQAAGQAELSASIVRISEEGSDVIQHKLEEELGRFAMNFQAKANTYLPTELPDNSLNISLTVAPEGVIGTSNDSEVNCPSKIDPTILNLFSKAVESIQKEEITTVLKLGKEYFPKAFKGIGPVKMDRMACKAVDIKNIFSGGGAKAAQSATSSASKGASATPKAGFPWLQVVVDIGVAIYSYYQAEQEMQRQVDAMKRRQQAIEDNADTFCSSFRGQAEEVIKSCINEAFDPITVKLTQARGSKSGEARVLEREAAKIREQMATLSNLSFA
ncbi:50S ribosome-binding GTPase [Desulfurispirillum indicum]|uniref:GTPase n=1 Tax=Desulfurispirillum indicum TaxID=936456 RepID=UPI001CFB356D|nr:GTPase [Desulfurispirillum indicum]UCZ57123.1 50S ribosome-binding GTPase [Desulfurispirillum indicum]